MEMWCPVAGFVGWYEVSDQGDVRSVRYGPDGSLVWSRPMRFDHDSRGYQRVPLSGVVVKRRKYLVHRLVAEAFLGSPPFADAQVNHKDTNKANNAAWNLEWCTEAENKAHARAMGRYVLRRACHPGTKLTPSAVRAIRAAVGAPRRYLAECFGISVHLVSKIRSGEVWADVT